MTPTITHYKTCTYPALKPTDQEATYRAALELVARIDEDLTRGVGHWRTKAGVLLVKLDQVIQAILSDELMVSDELVSNV